jgi:hypothetical protein
VLLQKDGRVPSVPVELAAAVRIVEISGREAADLGALFRLFAERFEFPSYFGGNWAGFAELLTDLDWCPAQRYLVAVHDSSELLHDSPAERVTFLRVMTDVGAAWSTTVGRGPAWRGGEVPFKTVLLDSEQPDTANPSLREALRSASTPADWSQIQEFEIAGPRPLTGP